MFKSILIVGALLIATPIYAQLDVQIGNDRDHHDDSWHHDCDRDHWNVDHCDNTVIVDPDRGHDNDHGDRGVVVAPEGDHGGGHGGGHGGRK
jgi:hypothetical protein